MSDGNDDGLGGHPSTRYERIERIATGGMGEVWRARDTVLGREVAVKVLKQEYADDPTFRARFADEARHAAGLHHPGIAAIFDYGAVEGEAPYLVMELVDGRPLSDLLAGGRTIDPEQARLLALQVAEALAVAHQAGVVHRDVKPANLLVTPDGRVKITDFGIARATDSVQYTQTGQIVGTPHYLSPEQARGESASAASDVYALGVVLFECLNGSRPFVADSPIATALAHIREEVPPLPESVPTALADVVRRALAKNPAERYADGAAFAAALREPGDQPAALVTAPATDPAATQVLAGAVPAAAAAGPDTRATAQVTEPPPPEPVGDRRNRWPLYAAGLIALLVLAALLIAHPWTDDASSDDGSTPDQGTVRVHAADYIGHPVQQVQDALSAKGLKTKTHEVDNSGDHDAGTVADLDPTGQVKKGSTIALDVWAEPSSDKPEKPEKSKGPDKPKPSKPGPSTPTLPSTPGQSDSPGDNGGDNGSSNGGDNSGDSSNGSDNSGGTGSGTGTGTGTGTGAGTDVGSANQKSGGGASDAPAPSGRETKPGTGTRGD